MTTYYWLSFVDPEPDKFLGVCIVEADSICDASIVAHAEKCNPGGAVAGFAMNGEIPSEYLNRLVPDKDDAHQLGEDIYEHVAVSR